MMSARTAAPALQGVLSPVLTPFNADGTPSTGRFLRHCRWLLAQEVGLAVFGTNSEGNSLSLAEKLGLLDTLLDGGLPAARMLPGTGACNLPDAIALTRHAVQAGCGGVLMLPPFYYKGVSEEGLFRSFAQVIDAVQDARLRLYLYHIPPVSQIAITRPLIERLLKAYPGVIAGIKDSSGDWAHTRMLLQDFQPLGFDVFAGTETVLLETLRAGGAGCITATGNVNPSAILRLYRQWQGADAEQQQASLNATRAVFQGFPMIASMKAAIAWKSGDAGWGRVRAPLVELDETQQRALLQLLDDLGFDLPQAGLLAEQGREPAHPPS